MYRLTARKTHNIRGFWHEKRMREKPESHTCVLVSGAHARLLYSFDRTRVVRMLKVTLTKNPNNTGEIERLHWQKTSEISVGISKNHAAEVGFSIQVVFKVAATFMRERFGFFDASVSTNVLNQGPTMLNICL